MDPVHVEVVRTQPAQARLQGQPEVLAMVACGIHIGAVAGDDVLRREHEAVPSTCQRLAENTLAPAVGIGCVDDVATGLGIESRRAAGTPPRKTSETRRPVWPNKR
jgi:hypothetical protein